MLKIKGKGLIVSDPVIDLSRRNGYFEILYKSKGDKTIRIMTNEYLIAIGMRPLKKGLYIAFEGQLDETEPGYYYIDVTHMRIIDNPRRYYVKKRYRSKG